MKFVIFDIDGTLTDTKTVDDYCFTIAFNSIFGLDLSNYDWSTLNDVTDWGITEQLVQNFLKANEILSIVNS